MSDILSRLLEEKDCLIADGAQGTNYMAMGLTPGQPPDFWNTERPDRVQGLHQSFIEAGADLILTNTFGSTGYRLRMDKAQDRAVEINLAGARLARAAADAAANDLGRKVVVAGSMGPTGGMMEPLGTMTAIEAEETYTEQAAALAEGGVDVIWIETIFMFGELAAAARAAAKTGLPVASTMTFDTAGFTMMGDSPEKAVEFVHGLNETLPKPLAAFGANCGAGAAMLVDSICGIARAAGEGEIITAKGNCGVPEFKDGQVVYSGTVEVMAAYARLARDAGARIIGGCCGTTPQHLAAIARALDGYVPGPTPDRAAIEAALGPVKTAGKSRAKRG